MSKNKKHNKSHKPKKKTKAEKKKEIEAWRKKMFGNVKGEDVDFGSGEGGCYYTPGGYRTSNTIGAGRGGD